MTDDWIDQSEHRTEGRSLHDETEQTDLPQGTLTPNFFILHFDVRMRQFFLFFLMCLSSFLVLVVS